MATSKRSGRAKPPPFTPWRPDQYVRPGISPQQQLRIGQIVFSWSLLENALEDLIWHFVNIPMDDGRLLTGRLDAGHKLLILRGLADRYLNEAREDFLNSLNTIQDLYEWRSFVVHATWFTLMPESIPAGASLRRKLDPSEADRDRVSCETFPDRRMVQIIEHMTVMLNELQEVMNALAATHNRPYVSPTPETPAE
jgi:hypothetical protein